MKISIMKDGKESILYYSEKLNREVFDEVYETIDKSTNDALAVISILDLKNLLSEMILRNNDLLKYFSDGVSYGIKIGIEVTEKRYEDIIEKSIVTLNNAPYDKLLNELEKRKDEKKKYTHIAVSKLYELLNTAYEAGVAKGKDNSLF